MNRTTVIGRVGKDAEVKILQSGDAVINFTIAWSEKYKDRNGEQKETTVWYDCSIFRKPDQVKIADYIKKGGMVLVEGRITARAYTNGAGEVVAALGITVKDIQLLGGGQNQAPAQQEQRPPRREDSPPELPVYQNNNAKNDFFDSMESDDLPF